MKPRLALVLVATATLLLGACGPEEWNPEELALGHTSAHRNALNRGRALYARYCVGCHGEEGDGAGPAARFLDPKPRDFRTGRMKFALVESGQSPNDADYLRVITNGLYGTAMPSFRFVGLEDRQALVRYVRSFYKDPEEGISVGRKLYHGMAQCWSCHPAYLTKDALKANLEEAKLPFSGFRDSMYTAIYKESQWGTKTRVPDFLVHRLRNGNRPEQIVRIIAAGVGGTAMPTWAEALDEEQLWGLAHYVSSLARMRNTEEAFALKKKLLEQN